MKRKTLLELIRICGYKNDKQEATRLFIENNISRKLFDQYYKLGQEQSK